MSYITDIADAIKAKVPLKLLPAGDVDGLFLVYASLALAKGTSVTTEDVHNAWAAWMATTEPDHDAIKPFADLDDATRKEDSPFLRAILQVAEQSKIARR